MKKILSVLVTVTVLSLGLTACNGGDNSDCESSGSADVVTMSLIDGKSGGSSGGRSGSRSSGGKSSKKSGGSKGKTKKHKSHDFDDDCDD